MAILTITSNSAERTQQIGLLLGKLVQPGDVLLLSGNLGSGKTCLTQGIARGLGINEYTLSPTFVLIREYYGRLPLYHIDLYRLNDSQDMLNIGLDDYLYSDGVCVIEWAEKGIPVLPHDNLLVKLVYISENERKLTFEPHGEHYDQLLKLLAQKL